MNDTARQARPGLPFSLFTAIAGVIGWFASFELLTEYVKTLQDSSYVPNCSVSKLVTCGPNMGSPEGSVFGFSNTIIGVAAFVVPILIGVAMLSGVRFPVWFNWGYLAGLLFGVSFVTWLQVKSIFVLGTLCPWCMVVWSVVIPLWWISLFVLMSRGALGQSRGLRRVGAVWAPWAWVVAVSHMLVVATVAQVALDWFAEFRI